MKKRIHPKEYAQALFELTKGKTESESKSIVAHFVDVLRKNHQVKQYRSIISYFSGIANDAENICEVAIKTGIPLDDMSREKISRLLEEKYPKKKFVIKEKIDPTLQGGVVVQVGEEIIDASISNVLMKFRRHIISNIK